MINLVFINSLLANEIIDIQYYFDKRYDYYSDSERVSARINRRTFYKHSEIFEEALSEYEKTYQKFSFKQCNVHNESALIIKFEPNFFYNPLMQTMYADLNYYIYEEPSQQIKRGSLSLQKQIYLQARPSIQLKNIYLEFLNKLNGVIPKVSSNFRIKGSFCSIL